MRIIRPATINDAALVSSTIPETDYAAWSAATTYAVGDRVIVVATHRIYESLKAANTNHNPPDNLTATDPEIPWWKELSATARWKMFDGKTGAASTAAAGEITVVLSPGQVSGLALLALDATAVEITMDDSGEGEVYHAEIDLISQSGIGDWYDYFFEPIVRLASLAITDLPPYATATLTVTISHTDGPVGVGELVTGQLRRLGIDIYGAGAGITDYSNKDTDDAGSYSVAEGAFSHTSSVDLLVDTALVSELHRLLASYRATPLVWIGDGDYAALLVYGFCRDFGVVIAGPTHSSCNLEIEGLT